MSKIEKLLDDNAKLIADIEWLDDYTERLDEIRIKLSTRRKEINRLEAESDEWMEKARQLILERGEWILKQS